MTAGPAATAVHPNATELAALRRPFMLGAMACVAALVCLGGVLAAFGQVDARPAGVAERWLAAVSDATRDGMAADAGARALEIGAPLELATDAGLVPADTDGRGAFEELRVGRAVPAGSAGSAGSAGAPARPVVRVPFVATPRGGDPAGGHLFLWSTDDGWQVLGLQRADETGVALAVELSAAAIEPAPPGAVAVDRPEPAPVGWWLGTLVVGVLVAAGCTLAVDAATPDDR